MANMLSTAGICCTQAASSATRAHWVGIPTPALHAQQQLCMQQRSILPVTPAAFRALPGSSSAPNSLYRSSGDVACLPSPACRTSSSMPTHCPAWQLDCSLQRASAAADGTLACLCSDWPLLLPDNSNSSSTGVNSSSATTPSETAAATTTVANVLLLLGNATDSSSVITRDSSSSNVRTGDSSPVTAPAFTMHGAGCGCPPNAPVRRPPPVMLLPAQELPALMLAGQ